MPNPPGIAGDWECVKADDNKTAWLTLPPMKEYTNAFIWCEKDRKVRFVNSWPSYPYHNQLLLGMKKRGFGVNMLVESLVSQIVAYLLLSKQV
jgi:hypothetical protein